MGEMRHYRWQDRPIHYLDRVLLRLCRAQHRANRPLAKPVFCSSSRKIDVEKRSVLGVREHHKQRFDDEIGQKTQLCKRSNPSADLPEVQLTESERRHAAGLMRVNHAGERCAQALYASQALCASDPIVREALQHSAQEEMDHLRWCSERLQQLNSHPSYLNPIWVLGSFIIGLSMGLMGDTYSLGFLAETEIQVAAHLRRHLSALPKADIISYRIVEQMCLDEEKHQVTAEKMGAKDLPSAIKYLMTLCSRVMIYFAYKF